MRLHLAVVCSACMAACPALFAQEPPEEEAALEPAVTVSPDERPGEPRPGDEVQTATPEPGASGGARSSRALDRIELESTQIIGNRELPKVLYIVPWKRSDLGDLVGKPVNSLLDEVLAPVDRDVFKRENRYYGVLRTESLEPASTPVPDVRGAPSAPARDEK